MTLSILFPDGIRRDVPGQLKPVYARPGDCRSLSFIQVPVNHDPFWRYERSPSGWRALPRRQAQTPILPAPPLGWQPSLHRPIVGPPRPETIAAA